MSEKQAQELDVKAYTQWSPYLEKCCLWLSANESYERAAEDIQVLTGVVMSHSTQQRLVHRQTFDLPQVGQTVEEMSVDGGKVRLRTPKGEPSDWRDYKAVNLHQCCVSAFFQENSSSMSISSRSESSAVSCNTT
ncbi:MAG: hypothetical protein HC769_30890 [Cyanobacteria bacterium CRU_2_1]|nr:hypothetical protein [Cyanobacteria bacterium CRU_2_1]